jgi:diguanylate cyclase
VFRLDRRDDFDIAHFARLRALSVTDPLTGLGDRRALREMVESCEAGRRSQERPYAVLMIDLDHFKQINDQYGHVGGDAALRHVAATIRGALRASDTAFRFGGEEFVVILPGTPLEGARLVAERVRQVFRGYGCPICACVTVSHTM